MRATTELYLVICSGRLCWGINDCRRARVLAAAGYPKSNMVAAAVEVAGGVTAVSKLCGVARQSVYTWIEEWRVERLAGEAFKPARIPAAKSPASIHRDDEDRE